jgi:O-succinylbenzoate synthase
MGTALREAVLLRVRLPLVEPFRTARTTTTTKDALLVRVQTDAGVGWGECTAPASPEYDGETIDGARSALREHLLPRAFAGAAFDDVPGNRAARAALECALLDARLRADGIPLRIWLGAGETVPAGVAAGLNGDLEELRSKVQAYAAAGYRRIKCKIEPGRDVEVLRAVRAELGAAIEVAADANGSYELDAARRLFDAIDELRLQCVEQPCAADAVDEHATLVAEARTPVCLDEPVTSAAAARLLIARRACDALAVKVGRLGIAGARRVHDECVAASIPALAGGMIETGVGRAALLAVAALPGFTRVGDCAGSDRFFGRDGDITEPFTVVDGALRVPSGPGLGVEPIAERLAQTTIARERVTARG